VKQANIPLVCRPCKPSSAGDGKSGNFSNYNLHLINYSLPVRRRFVFFSASQAADPVAFAGGVIAERSKLAVAGGNV
jgi:hypothetical protein